MLRNLEILRKLMLPFINKYREGKRKKNKGKKMVEMNAKKIREKLVEMNVNIS